MPVEHEKRVKVALRLRPPLDRERYEGICARKVGDTSVTVTSEGSPGARPQVLTAVDGVFDADDDQRTVYEESVQELIDHALDGCNSTIFAYGQTGSGKTHTILGEISPEGIIGQKTGIFLRVFDDLFRYRQAAASHKHVIIALSAIELYLEEVLDLLNEKNVVKIRERGDDTLLPGVLSFPVASMEDVLRYFRVANAYRSVSATKMNDESSRSHAIFLIDIFTLPRAAGSPTNQQPPSLDELAGMDPLPPGMTRSRISLIDLAGSERVKKSGVEGKLLQEANAINKSLTTLRTVIHAMYTESVHLPFRDSKLTKLLRSAFTDPTSRLLLVGQISPCDESYSETVGTIRFCDDIKNLKTSTRCPFIDPQEEAMYLEVLRRNEELGAELRICSLENFYSAMFVTAFARKNRLSREAAVDRLCPKAATQAAIARQHFESSVILDAERSAREEVEEYCQVRRRRLHEAESAYAEVTAWSVESSALYASQKANFEEESEKRTTAAKKAKKSRLHAEEKIEKLKKKIEKSKKELEKVRKESSSATSSGARASGGHTALEPEDEEEWNEFEEDWHIAECNHAITEEFHRYYSENTQLRGEMIRHLRQTETQWGVVNEVRAEAASSALGSLLPDVIHFVIDRSVDIAEGYVDWKDSYSWIDIQGSSTKMRPPASWSLPFPISVDDREPPVAVIDPPNVTVISDVEFDDVAGTSRRDSRAGLSAEHKKEKKEKKKKSALTKKHDTAEADKRYLMSVYDSRTLVSDVLRYLASGTTMLKHGRNGSPHMRKFWITTIGAREMVWVDPDQKQAKRSTLPLGEVSAIILGPFSKVFRRHPVGYDSKDYWRSFTLTLKDGSRTLDIVAGSLVDFEAWVLGLAHLVHVDPVWGKPLNLKAEPVEPATQLLPEEFALCEQNHIWKNEYFKVKKVVDEHRQEVERHMRLFEGDANHAFDALGGIHVPQVNHKGAVLMTKGELRFYCNQYEIDIFRVCKIWELFAKYDIIYDPSYTPATSFGISKKI